MRTPRRLPSLAVLLNPSRKITGDEKKKLDQQHADLAKEMG